MLSEVGVWMGLGRWGRVSWYACHVMIKIPTNRKKIRKDGWNLSDLPEKIRLPWMRRRFTKRAPLVFAGPLRCHDFICFCAKGFPHNLLNANTSRPRSLRNQAEKERDRSDFHGRSGTDIGDQECWVRLAVATERMRTGDWPSNSCGRSGSPGILVQVLRLLKTRLD